MSVCAVVWCDRDAVARGLCKRCYARYRQGVSPVGGARAYATSVDKERLRGEIVQRREGGESIADIAAVVGVSTSTAGKWLREWGVEVGHRENARPANLWQPWTRGDVDFAVGRTDLTIAERAEALGRSVSSIEDCLRKYGLVTTDGTVPRRA